MTKTTELEQPAPVFPVERPVGPRYLITVPVGGGAVHFLPNPVADPHIEWMLRYCPDGLNDNRNSVRLAAASVLDGFEYLCSQHISMKEATRRLRLLRAARRAALKPNAKAHATPRPETSHE